MNRAKACVVEDVHEWHNGIEQTKEKEGMEGNRYVEEYISRKLGLKADDRAFNIGLINGRLKEISDCVSHLEHMRASYSCEFMKEWSERLSADFPHCKKCEDIRPGDIMYTGITIPYKDKPDAIAIRIQVERRSLYYGLTYMPETKAIRTELQEAMSFINDGNDFIIGSDWLYYKYTSFEEGYDVLKNLISLLIDHISIIIQDRNDAIRILGRMGVDTSTKNDDEINELIRGYLGIDFSKDNSVYIDFDKVVVPDDTAFSESHIGPTPTGGAYSTAFFYDENDRPCRREQASYMNIVEYSMEGERINEVYGMKTNKDL